MASTLSAIHEYEKKEDRSLLSELFALFVKKYSIQYKMFPLAPNSVVNVCDFMVVLQTYVFYSLLQEIIKMHYPSTLHKEIINATESPIEEAVLLDAKFTIKDKEECKTYLYYVIYLPIMSFTSSMIQ